MSQANFINLNAAADALVNGGIIVPEFQKEITDLVRRSGVLQNRIQYVPATGSPSRFFEQTAIGMGAFTSGGGSLGGSINPTATSPTRVEKSVTMKAITNRIDYSLFDLETVAQQGVFPQLKAKDMTDMVNGMLLIHGQALWTGTDTVSGGQVGAGTTNQYVGILSQVTNTTTIASSASIIDSIRTKAAQLAASNTYNLLGKKFSLYINPLALDLLEQEAKNSTTMMRYIASDLDNVGVGITVDGIRTALGVLPIIPEPFLGMDIPGFLTAASGGQHNYAFAIVSEDLIEYHYIGSKEPRVFQLGTLANLNESYVGVLFGAPVVKGASYAHVVGNIQK